MNFLSEIPNRNSVPDTVEWGSESYILETTENQSLNTKKNFKQC